MSGQTLVEFIGVTRRFPLPRHALLAPRSFLTAVNDVSFTVTKGRSVGLVGESGSGKSTLARLALGLDRPSAGIVRLLGADLSATPARTLRLLRRQAQIVFQDPFGSLDPRRTIGWSIAEPLAALTGMNRAERRREVLRVLEQVGLVASAADRYPHEFSGGQRQRIAIARALVTRPALVVADEPVSALDVSVRAQILNLLRDLQDRHGVTLLMISHDLAVIDYLCDDLVVLREGRVEEAGPTMAVLRAPARPYTRDLIGAARRRG